MQKFILLALLLTGCAAGTYGPYAPPVAVNPHAGVAPGSYAPCNPPWPYVNQPYCYPLSYVTVAGGWPYWGGWWGGGCYNHGDYYCPH